MEYDSQQKISYILKRWNGRSMCMKKDIWYKTIVGTRTTAKYGSEFHSIIKICCTSYEDFIF